MNFGQAIEALKRGRRVARAGWNGKGMWLEYVGGDQWEDAAHSVDAASSPAPFIAMRTAQQTIVPWLASQTDMLAEDWEVVS